VVVDRTGVVVRAGAPAPVVVEFDGQYVWSFVPSREGRRRREGWLAPWPDVLAPYLRGTARVSVRSGELVHFDDEVRFDASPERTRVVDGQGHPLAVDKVGHLARVFAETDDAVRAEVLDGTARALRELREHCGVDAYLCYGALLGAVRDGRMIGHDSDTDVCYFSRHNSPADVIAESYRVERRMRALGWNLLRMSGGDLKLLLPLSDGRQCHIDVFVAFTVGATFFQLGNRSGTLPRDAVLPTSTVTLEGRTFPAPRDPEAMLRFVYGPGWRTPDPSFKYADPPAGIRRLDGWLRGFRTDMPAWTGVHRGPRGAGLPWTPSDFGRWVDARLPAGDGVADLGCGNGRDTVRFARSGRPVRGFDFSRAAVTRTNRRLERLHAVGRADKLVLDELRTVLLTAAELAHAGPTYHLYARQLLGCLDRPARENLWLLATTALRGGGALFLEFSAGPELPRQHPLVRRLDPARIRGELVARGAIVVHEEVGPGTDVLDQPDPAVCRMEVRFPHPPRRNPMSPTPETGLARRVVRAARRRAPGRTRRRLAELEQAVQENRQLNRRIAELTDVVAELLVPLAHSDPARVEQVLAQYRASI
jgi:SAM-dependent methyltransferase